MNRRTKSFRAGGFDKGMDRSRPRHLIGDNNLWTAENVRFGAGKVMPILIELEKYSLEVENSGHGIFALDYRPPSVSYGANHFIITYDDNSGAKTITVRIGDAYASALGTLNLSTAVTNVMPADVDINGNYFHIGTKTLGLTTRKYIIRWDGAANLYEDLVSAAFSTLFVRVFSNYLFTNYDGAGIPQLKWSEYGNLTVFTGGQSGTRSQTFPLASLEILGNYLVLYGIKGISRLSYIGPPTLFNVEEISRDIGAYPDNNYSNSLSRPTLEKNGINYFVSDPDTRNILVFNGNSFQQIGLPIRDHMFSLLDGNASSQVIVTQNPPKDEICFWVMKTYSTFSSNCHLYIYNYVTQAWSYTDLPSSIYTGADHMAAFTRRFAPDMRFALKKTIDSVHSYKVYKADAGASMKVPTVETKLYDFGRPDIFKRLLSLDILLSVGVAKDFTIGIAALEDPEDTPSYTNFTLSFANSGTVYPDMTGRYFAVKITTASTDYTTIWELTDMIFEYIEQGAK